MEREGTQEKGGRMLKTPATYRTVKMLETGTQNPHLIYIVRATFKYCHITIIPYRYLLTS